jgi:prepilin signal peptidase PulO-like enzyme (type II secretory pathway)
MIDNHFISILLPVAFAVGASVGSFVTVASYRLPRGEEIVFKPSHCPHCAAVLKARDLFPVFSWALQRGRCRYCKMAIGARYPVTELALGLAFAGLFIAYGLSFKALILAFLVTELAILIVTDLEHTIIPDGVQIALFFTGIVYCNWRDFAWSDVLWSAASGLMLGLLLHFGYKALRKKDGLGWADVKFLCVAGVWLPPASFVSFLFFAGVFGTLTGLIWRALGRGPLFPFGPALAASLLLNVLFPDLLEKLL